MTDVKQEDVNHALEVLGLTLPVTAETLAKSRRALLYTWDPARYSNLTNNPKKIYGIDGYGLTVVEQVPIRIEPGEHNRAYLETKKRKLGHKL